MKIQTAVQLAVLMTAMSHAQAVAVTVKSYQATKTSNSTDATFNKLYITGLGDGMRATNFSMFLHVQSNLHLQSEQLNAAMLFCPPPMLALQEENFESILDIEIQRRLDQAAGDPSKVERVMETPIEMVLLDGLKQTFPCSPAKIQEWAGELVRAFEQQTPSKNKK